MFGSRLVRFCQTTSSFFSFPFVWKVPPAGDIWSLKTASTFHAEGPHRKRSAACHSLQDSRFQAHPRNAAHDASKNELKARGHSSSVFTERSSRKSLGALHAALSIPNFRHEAMDVLTTTLPSSHSLVGGTDTALHVILWRIFYRDFQPFARRLCGLIRILVIVGVCSR